MSQATGIPSWGNGTSPPPPLPSIMFSQSNSGSNVPQVTNFQIGLSNVSPSNFMTHTNESVGKFNGNIFAHNSSSPRKRTRVKMEEAFRTMSLKHEHEMTSPARKRQEIWYHRDVTSSPQNVSTHALDHPDGRFSLSASSLLSRTKESSMDEDDIDDENSEATATTANTTCENNAVKEVMYSLVFGSQRPVSSKKSCQSLPNSLLPLTHVDAKIEKMIRKDRLKAMIMTGKPNHDSSSYGKCTISGRGISVRDDFNVNVMTDYNQNKSSNQFFEQDCDMNGNGNSLIRRSRSFDDLDMCM